MKQLNTTLNKPLDPNNKAEWATLRKMQVAIRRHSTGYVLVDAGLAHQPRPGAGKKGGVTNPAIIKFLTFNTAVF